MRIATNISAMVSNNSLQKAENRLSKSIAKLSSGYKINKSSDDAAGYAITQKMRMQIRGLNQSNNNASDGMSVLYTAEGGLEEIQNMLARMKELSVQAANDTNSSDERSAIQEEMNSLVSEINRISNDTEFNSQSIINGNLSRRVYSNYETVNQLEISDGFAAGDYGIVVEQDARQAVAMAEGSIAMSDGQTITKEQEGVISLNGYDVTVSEGDTVNDIMNKIVSAASSTGASAFTVADGATPDTKANGTQYAGYEPSSDITGSKLVIMTNECGSSKQMTVTCNNEELANLLGMPSAATEDALFAEGSDVKAKIATDNNGDRKGFSDSAVISTNGTKITITDVNNKTFKIDVPSNIAGTTFDDSARTDGKSAATSTSTSEIIQEVTDVGRMSVHVGANENQVVLVDIPEVSSYTLGLDNINVMTHLNASESIEKVDEAVSYVNAVRSKLGAYENRFEHTSSNIATGTENMTQSVSVLADTDMAEEMTEYTTLNVMTQAATSILSQANERPSTVLQLLQ